MSAATVTVAVTVVWATPEVQDSVPLTLPAGATVADALAASGLVERHGIDRGAVRPAVYGRLVRDDVALRDGDRVEICRPLLVDVPIMVIYNMYIFDLTRNHNENNYL